MAGGHYLPSVLWELDHALVNPVVTIPDEDGGGNVASYWYPKLKLIYTQFYSTGLKQGRGVLIAIDSSLMSHHRFDYESYSECLWFQVRTANGVNLIIGIYYFPPIVNETILFEHLESLEQQIDSDMYRPQI